MPEAQAPSALHAFADSIASPLVDVLTFLGYLWLVPLIKQAFAGGSMLNAVIILAAYVLLCLGVLLGRSLEEPEVKAGFGPKTQGCAAWLAWTFTAFVLVALIEATGGVTAEAGKPSLFGYMSESGTLLMIVLALALLAIFAAFPLAVILPVKRRIGRQNVLHTPSKLISVALANTMVLVTIAFWQWYFANSEPMDISLGGHIFVFLALFPVFLMFYAPPRLVLLSLDDNGWGAVTYTVLLGITAWQFNI